MGAFSLIVVINLLNSGRMLDFDPLETQDIKKKEIIWKEWMYGGEQEEAENFQPISLDLHTAASLGLYDAVRDLLTADGKEGSGHSVKNVGGWTPLMYASYIGHDTVLDLLLEAGADVHGVNRKGRTALMLACCCGNEAAAYTLLQAGAKIEDMDFRGKTALFHAVSNGHHSLTRTMLESGANPNVKERLQGFTPLIEAAVEDQQLIVEALLEFGADWRPKLLSGESARTLAVKYNNLDIVRMIDKRINESQKQHRVRYARGSGTEEGDDILKPRGSELLRRNSYTSANSSPTSSAGGVVNRNAVHPPPCAKSPSIHEGPMSFAKTMSNNQSKSTPPVQAPCDRNDDNEVTIKNPDSSWNASSSTSNRRTESASAVAPTVNETSRNKENRGAHQASSKLKMWILTSSSQ